MGFLTTPFHSLCNVVTNDKHLLTGMRLLHSPPAGGSFAMTGRCNNQGRGQKGRQPSLRTRAAGKATSGLSALSPSSTAAPVIAMERPRKALGRRERLKQSHSRKVLIRPRKKDECQANQATNVSNCHCHLHICQIFGSPFGMTSSPTTQGSS